MIISELILESLGANLQTYEAADFIFSEGDTPKYYYQIKAGRIKLNNYNAEGREVLQDVLEKGQSVGESLLFTDGLKYPLNAVSVSTCEVFRLPKTAFFDYLNKNPEMCIVFNKNISKALYFKQIMSQMLCIKNPILKLTTLLDYYKSIQKNKDRFAFQIPFTRQEIANLSGLCVETTIRAIKVMEQNKVVKIKNRKILY